MYKRTVFVEEFARLLETLPRDYSFRELQFDYRVVVFLMGQKILERFPEVLVGPEPCGEELYAYEEGGAGNRLQPIKPAPGHGGAGGPTIGPYPHWLCQYVCNLINS